MIPPFYLNRGYVTQDKTTNSSFPNSALSHLTPPLEALFLKPDHVLQGSAVPLEMQKKSYTVNPSATQRVLALGGLVEAKGSGVQGQPQLCSEFETKPQLQEERDCATVMPLLRAKPSADGWARGPATARAPVAK